MPSFIHYNQLIRNLSDANGMKVQISGECFSLNTIKIHINGKPLVKMSILIEVHAVFTTSLNTLITS